jgi:hypothetical protein
VWNLEGESGDSIFEFWSKTAPPAKAHLEQFDDETRARLREARRYVLVLGTRR